MNCPDPRELVNRSGIPSLLTSPVTITVGSDPTGKVSVFLKVPSPIPNRTDNVLFLVLADTKSKEPSKFKSLVRISAGPLPTLNTHCICKIRLEVEREVQFDTLMIQIEKLMPI